MAWASRNCSGLSALNHLQRPLMVRMRAPLAARRPFFDKVDRDWEKAWQQQVTPWETRSVSPPLVDLFQSGRVTPPSGSTGRALVPGCGSGLECAFLHEAGYGFIRGLDISPTAIAQAKMTLTKQLAISRPDTLAAISLDAADYFAYQDEPYHFIFDYLFFAALDPPMRTQWAQATARLLSRDPNARLFTLVFPLFNNPAQQDPTVGPPYPVTLEDYKSVLEPLGLKLRESYMAHNSIKPRKDRELVALWSF